MPYLCTFAISGESIVLEDNPNDLTTFKRVDLFSTRDDAHTALMLVRHAESAVQRRVDEAVMPVHEELAEKLEKQAEIIRKQQVTISAFKVSLEGARNLMERAFNTIATDLVIIATHRERNEIYRHIARALHQWLQYPHESANMDYIPF